jgi:hypothetical protein
MSEVRLSIDRNEWTQLAEVAELVEARLVGSTLRLTGSASTGFGLWTVHGQDGTMVTLPSLRRVDESLDIGVSIRLVEQAALLVRSADRCDLVLRGDGVQRLEASSGARFIIDEMPIIEHLAIEDSERQAVAEVFGRDLRAAISGVVQFMVSEIEGWPPPSSNLTIEEDGVRLSVDWRPYGGPRITTSLPASGTEPGESVACPLVSVYQLLTHTRDDDARIRVVVGDETVVFECLDAHRGWTATGPVRLAGAWRWAPRFIGVFEEHGHCTGVIEPGVLSDLGRTGVEPEVKITFHDTDPEVARLTLVHPGSPAGSSRLLGEVNELNHRKTELRFWVDQGSGSLVACYDLPCHRFVEVAEWADRLREETDGIDILWRSAS